MIIRVRIDHLVVIPSWRSKSQRVEKNRSILLPIASSDASIALEPSAVESTTSVPAHLKQSINIGITQYATDDIVFVVQVHEKAAGEDFTTIYCNCIQRKAQCDNERGTQ